MRHCIIFLFFLLITTFVFAQTEEDRLFSVINKTTQPAHRLQAITALTGHTFNIRRDSLDKYAYEAKSLATKQADQLLKAKAAQLMAAMYFRWGWTDSCIQTANEALQYCKPQQPAMRPIYFELQRLKALSYGGKNDYTSALNILYKLIEEADVYNEDFPAGINSNTIGSISLLRGNVDEALRWIRRAFAYTSKTDDPLLAASCYGNLAMAFHQQGKADSALYYIQKAVPLSIASKNFSVIVICLQIQSSIDMERGKIKEAENALQQMIAYRKMSGEEDSYMDDKLLMADFYIKTKQINKAIELCKASLKTGNIYDYDSTAGSQSFTNNITNRLLFYEKLAECYKISGDKNAYADALENIIIAKDTLYERNSTHALAEMQTKFEVQQKETTIAKQKLLLAKRQNTIIAVLAIISLLAVISFFLFREYRKKQKRRNTAAVKDAEEKERRRIAVDLHDNLGVQANAILYTSELLKQGENKDGELVDNMNETAKDMLFFLRETLWALKSADTTTTQLWFRILNFTNQMKRNYPHLEFITEGNANTEKPISSAKALNVLMIVQEATNNCIKHSKATTIKISSLLENNEWLITVADNGTGFSMNEAEEKEESNGLKNMRQRADSSGIQLQIIPQIKKGTAIKILISFQ